MYLIYVNHKYIMRLLKDLVLVGLASFIYIKNSTCVFTILVYSLQTSSWVAYVTSRRSCLIIYNIFYTTHGNPESLQEAPKNMKNINIHQLKDLLISKWPSVQLSWKLEGAEDWPKLRARVIRTWEGRQWVETDLTLIIN